MLPGRHSPRRHSHLAQLRTRPSLKRLLVEAVSPEVAREAKLGARRWVALVVKHLRVMLLRMERRGQVPAEARAQRIPRHSMAREHVHYAGAEPWLGRWGR